LGEQSGELDLRLDHGGARLQDAKPVALGEVDAAPSGLLPRAKS
jgi:hypothetical protein